MVRVEAAGCVVLRRTLLRTRVLLVWTVGYADPTLPKGRVEPGETALECALREVTEETGYTVEVTHKVLGAAQQAIPRQDGRSIRVLRQGDCKPDSDIDVAVVVDGLDGDFLDAHTQVFRLRRNVDLRIEPVLVDESNERSGFLKEMLSTGYVVYRADDGADDDGADDVGSRGHRRACRRVWPTGYRRVCLYLAL